MGMVGNGVSELPQERVQENDVECKTCGNIEPKSKHAS